MGNFARSFGSAAGLVLGIYAGYKVINAIEKYSKNREGCKAPEQAAPEPAKA